MLLKGRKASRDQRRSIGMNRNRGPPRPKNEPKYTRRRRRREAPSRTGISVRWRCVVHNPKRFKEKDMRKAQAFAKKITEWELTNPNLKPPLQEMPYLQEIVTALEALIAEAKGLDSQQEASR